MLITLSNWIFMQLLDKQMIYKLFICQVNKLVRHMALLGSRDSPVYFSPGTYLTGLPLRAILKRSLVRRVRGAVLPSGDLSQKSETALHVTSINSNCENRYRWRIIWEKKRQNDLDQVNCPNLTHVLYIIH